ncbi:hypothetical protein [Actinoallomurus soli]|uniref:hypothetical protein n=1 Tax=Actinoallomurus soli TaxID=2952535 RepID=UPI002092C8CC|nr:hypothetical protein [Actinoallomurus soli]MCO5972866.1 hypothetical protein [Actinoallomurus soli]
MTNLLIPAPPRPYGTSAPRRPLGGHGAFAVLLALAAGLRITTMLGYRPARIYYGDSFAYLSLAAHPRPSWGFQPSGYPFLLALLRPFHSVTFVVATQHALGLATGMLVYAVLRRHSLPAWGAAAAAVPQLFDASFLQLEHAVLSDALFIFLVVAAITVLMWSPGPATRAGAVAGALLGLAALTRTIALPLFLLVLAHLVVRRTGRRPVLATAVVGALPIVLYASWYASVYGRFTLAGGDGVALWARTMTFANCRVILPPEREARLCPAGTRQDAAGEYVWAADSPINRFPGGPAAANDVARSFALRAIAAQPLDYAADVAGDVSLAFHWTPARHPKRVTPAFGFAKGRVPLPDVPEARRALASYDPGAGDYRSVEPYAGFLRVYQYPAYLRGPVLAAILAVGALGVRRRARLPWIAAAALLVLPVAVLDFDHRYVLPVVPVACIAAALAVADLWMGRRHPLPPRSPLIGD